MSDFDYYICPVCGWDKIEEFPNNTFEICPCCGTEYGVADNGYQDIASWEFLRQIWIENGYRWWSNMQNPPEDWQPLKQLKNAKKLFLPQGKSNEG